MAKQKEVLFPGLNTARFGETARRRHLFLARYLDEAASDERLKNNAYQAAQQIMIKWADLEKTGKLLKMNESQLEGEFLTEVFGQALGYRLFSENAPEWHVQAKFPVNGGVADAALGTFAAGATTSPRAVIELKGPQVDLDRDRSGGRTAVQQCWDYLNNLPECPWGIVSNYVSFRLYHRQQTPRVYESFTLQELRKEKFFARFYCLFQWGGLLPPGLGQRPRAEILLEDTGKQQSSVGDKLYADYHRNRVAMIRHLCADPHQMPLETALRIAQKLLDRIVFVAFCEDRGLLPENSIHRAYWELPPFYRVINPRWQNFLALFHFIDQGEKRFGIPPYNGGLFRPDPEVDNLQLDDDWTEFFHNVGRYDFRDEVNVDVLGHLFERSIHDVERIRLAGLGAAASGPGGEAHMGKSAERKRQGIYYTPPEFTGFIVQHTIGALLEERFAAISAAAGITPEEYGTAQPTAALAQLWRERLAALRALRILDPACGSGAFLIAAYDLLENAYYDVIDHLAWHESAEPEPFRAQVADWILTENLHGVDLSAEAVEITQLALWIRSARPGKTLADLSKNIRCGNSLVTDPAVHPQAVNWPEIFAEVFSRPEAGFDAVIGNPPWERLKLQEREFFDGAAPAIAAAVNAATRRKLIGQLESQEPELFARYRAAQAAAEATLDYVRSCNRFPLTGVGDINTYAAFAELALNLVAPTGRVGLLVPSGIATDHTTRQFFASLTENDRLAGLYDFENKLPVFPDVHRSFKFCILLFGGAATRFAQAEFVFFAHAMADLEKPARRIALSGKDFRLFNPNSGTCPIFRTRRDAELTKGIYRRVPILIDYSRQAGGNPWGIKFFTMFHQTNDAERFLAAEQLTELKARRSGALWQKGRTRYLPLYEAKMVQMYDHRAASVIIDEKNWMRQGQTEPTSEVQHQNPEYTVEPRWWVESAIVDEALGQSDGVGYITYKDVTSATNQRTMIAAFIPHVAVLNSAPLIQTDPALTFRQKACLLANLNSFAYDFVARQKVGGVHLNFFIVEQLPTFGPAFYGDKCPWHARQSLETWISERVLKLTCTADDMQPLAAAAGFAPGVHPWKQSERIDLLAQLDAAYFLLYGLSRADATSILSSFSGLGDTSGEICGTQAQKILTHYDQLAAKRG